MIDRYRTTTGVHIDTSIAPNADDVIRIVAVRDFAAAVLAIDDWHVGHSGVRFTPS